MSQDAILITGAAGFIGFALAEATGLFGFVMAFLIFLK